ncbi:MAG: FtsW/RodA/SpoVE family cell cycle protein [Lachnospiraceae bacterium]
MARQQVNSIIAIGSGQLYGKGLDNNVVFVSKKRKFHFESQTDFIFAVAGEELGFLGCCIIIILELPDRFEVYQHREDMQRDLPGTLVGCGMGNFDLFRALSTSVLRLA